jgi:hypothetical protein
MSNNAEKNVNPDYFTTANLMSWLWLFNELDEGRKPGHEKWVRDLWRKWYYDEFKSQGRKASK